MRCEIGDSMQRADLGGEDQMTKEGNDREWSSESVHYWTVIRSDWNSIVKKGAQGAKLSQTAAT